jgi:hypothetical protein
MTPAEEVPMKTIYIKKYQIIDTDYNIYYELDGTSISDIYEYVPADIDHIIMQDGTSINNFIYDINKFYYVNIIKDNNDSTIYINDLQKTLIIKEIDLYKYSTQKQLYYEITEIDSTTYKITYDTSNVTIYDQVFIKFGFNDNYNVK